MEVLNPPIPNGPQIFSRVLLFSPKISIKIRNKKNLLKFYIPNSKFLQYSPFLTYLPFSKTRNFQVSAHFGRPSNRRNSLREKFFDDQQVCPIPISLDPNRSFDGNENFRYNLDYEGVKEIESNSRDGNNLVISGSEMEPKPKRVGESALLNKLENWVDQYKKDVEVWGIGSGPIFTVFQDLGGNVDRVVVNEDEILTRSGLRKLDDITEEVSLKISHAKLLAKELENGKCAIPKNSSVAKFVASGEETGFVNTIRGVTLPHDLFTKLSRVGMVVISSFFVFWAIKSLFSVRNQEVELTRLEKEMLRRKIKSRMEKENLEKGSVEVIRDSSDSPVLFTERPKLDKQELLNNIVKANTSNGNLALQDSSSSQINKLMDYNDKIQKIREMARHAREIEGESSSRVDRAGEKKLASDEEFSIEMEVVNQHGEEGMGSLGSLASGDLQKTMYIDESVESASIGYTKRDDTGFVRDLTSVENGVAQASSTSNVELLYDRESTSHELKDGATMSDLTERSKVSRYSEILHTQSQQLEKNSFKSPRVIRSVKEAREYLSRKHDKQVPNQEQHVKIKQECAAVLTPEIDIESGSKRSQGPSKENKVSDHSTLGGNLGISNATPATNSCEDPTVKAKESTLTKIDDHEDAKDKFVGSEIKPRTFHDDSGRTVAGASVDNENWMENNFHEFEPVLKKIGDGFRDSYMVAKEKVSRELNLDSEMTRLGINEDDSELEWMKDDALREIVFQVRENELLGRDPFYMMDAQDKVAFFKGLEKKVEKENEKLLNFHEWVHSNIENLDYGADGISIYDSPEKIIPRWKGPPVDKNPEFINNFVEQRKALVAKNAKIPHPVKSDGQESSHKLNESPSNENIVTSSSSFDIKKKVHDGVSIKSKTVIVGSDGSVTAGKKSGKEYWKHTKKWSRGFLDSYNAETDPEIKSTMKEIGKDLDRWITEKEIEEAAELMEKLPERNKIFIEKKLEKLKREMELFGPQAVVSKYREYADGNEEDCLWWLDLPFVLCIELYTNENGEQKIGFYSLEMAEDLDLEPKQYHVIAFEDSHDCKNLCYIIQAHMEMLGNGHAFVIARPPKDAFREAKANGFSVTVIRKGELQLNVDQTLEEVEEQITEIGSKTYHDKIMQERSVDINSLMKGVFGASKPTKRKMSKRRLKRPRQQ